MKASLMLNINGKDHAVHVEPRRTLADTIREDCGQTGTHTGCEHGVCGMHSCWTEKRCVGYVSGKGGS